MNTNLKKGIFSSVIVGGIIFGAITLTQEPKEINLREVQLIGSSYINVFQKENGDTYEVEITEREYIDLQHDPLYTTGDKRIYSYKANKYNTESSKLENGDYYIDAEGITHYKLPNLKFEFGVPQDETLKGADKLNKKLIISDISLLKEYDK